MNNNDIFKKLRVALMLRDDQIIEILELVDFRMSKGEIGNFFRNQDHPNYMECGDQVLRNFLNGLVIHLRGTKENPKNPNDVIAIHRAEAKQKNLRKTPTGEGQQVKLNLRLILKRTNGVQPNRLSIQKTKKLLLKFRWLKR